MSDGVEEGAGTLGPPWTALPSRPAPAPAVGLPIARVRKIRANEIWGTEPGAFVDSLRANLDALGDALGFRLQTSAAAGSDGSIGGAVEDAEGSAVIIVTELGPSTDHGLGLLLRQMVAASSRTAVWITTEPRRDHMASVSWLNRAGEGRFFVVRLRAVEIGDTTVAAMFAAAVRPPRATDPPPSQSKGSEAASSDHGRRAGDVELAHPSQVR